VLWPSSASRLAAMSSSMLRMVAPKGEIIKFPEISK
jgi:hypothetical protein